MPSLTMIDDCLDISECGPDSIIDNASIVAKIESKKLELNTDKCHKIHVGKPDKLCPPLKTHSAAMTEVLHERYLGSILTADGKNKKNIRALVSKLLGVISNIMNILREVSLGEHYFVIAKLLRNTMFLSAMLTRQV